MAKYIIDVPDEIIELMNGRFNLLIEPEVKVGEYRRYKVRLSDEDIVPYTEPDEDEIRQKAEDEVWKFAKKIGSFNGLAKRDLDECFGHTTIQGVMTTYDTYREAKREYEKWKKSKEEIRVGDEVIYNSRTRAVVLMPETEERYGTILTSEFCTIAVSHDDLEKTGSHFDEVEDLLKKMREGE